MWTEKLKVGDSVWIKDSWGNKNSRRVVISEIYWIGPKKNRQVQFRFTPKTFGNIMFGWNGTCQSHYHHALPTREVDGRV